jgi:hypothetical protein
VEKSKIDTQIHYKAGVPSWKADCNNTDEGLGIDLFVKNEQINNKNGNLWKEKTRKRENALNRAHRW